MKRSPNGPGVALALLLLTLGTRPLPAQVSEDFNAAGSAWSATIFPDLVSGVWSREPLSTSAGAPDATPALPINAGGDAEGRRTDHPAPSYALMQNVTANQFQDGVIDGYLAFALPDPGTGSRAAGFVLRAATLGGVNAYLAYLTNLPNAANAVLSIVRVRNDVIGGSGDTLAVSAPFAVNSGAENFRLRFAADGCTLEARLWRVAAAGGSVVETAVDLSFAAGVQDRLRAIDTELTVGRAGVHAFCRGGNSILCDDVTVAPASAGAFLRGDVDGDGVVSSPTDFVRIINYYVLGQPIPPPLDRADINDNEFVNLTDAVMLASWLNCGSPATLPSPQGTPGSDATIDCGGFGAVEPAYVVHLDPGTVTATDVEILVSLDTPAPLSVVEFTLQFSPALTPYGPAFTPASGLPPGTSPAEVVDGNLYFVSVRRDGCSPELLPAGSGQFLGSIVFAHGGTVPSCPSSLPVAWVADATVGGIGRRALMATTGFTDHHPDVQFGSCTIDIVRGDSDGDGTVDTTDFVRLLAHLFVASAGMDPLDCSAQANLDAGDANDNEYLTVADPLLIADGLFCGGPALPSPSSCGADPDDDKHGFDAVDAAYEARATAEVTVHKVAVTVAVKFPADARAAMVILEYDPAVLSPQTGADPLFCPQVGQSGAPLGAGAVADGDRVVINVAQGCGLLPAPATTTGFLELGTLYFTHAGGLTCAATSLAFVPEHVMSGSGVTLRATIVDSAYADHHPSLAAVTCVEAVQEFIRGDANGDGGVDISDPIFNLDYQFLGGSALCLDAHDANDDGIIDISDPIYHLAALFGGGPSVPPPTSATGCGDDPTPDAACRELGCAIYPHPGASFVCP